MEAGQSRITPPMPSLRWAPSTGTTVIRTIRCFFYLFIIYYPTRDLQRRLKACSSRESETCNTNSFEGVLLLSCPARGICAGVGRQG